MDLMAVYLLGMGVLLVVFVVAFGYAAMRRWQGKRSRFDSFVETFVGAQSRGIYPPSLRPDANPAVIEDVETTRGTNASRDTPNATPPRDANLGDD
jgi:hypothetical protein